MTHRKVDEGITTVITWETVLATGGTDITLSDWLATDAEIQEAIQLLGAPLLLSHAIDGINWGRWLDEVGWFTSHDAFPEQPTFPPFHPYTLQELRLFSGLGELFIWKSDSGFMTRLILDEETPNMHQTFRHYIDEAYTLWGTHIAGHHKEAGFMLLADGSQGLHHAIPMLYPFPDDINSMNRPLRLYLRHYATVDDATGFMRIATSRLFGIGE